MEEAGHGGASLPDSHSVAVNLVGFGHGNERVTAIVSALTPYA